MITTETLAKILHQEFEQDAWGDIVKRLNAEKAASESTASDS